MNRLGSTTAVDQGTAASDGSYVSNPVLGYPSPVEGTSMLVDVWANKHMSHPILTDTTFSVEFLARLDDLSPSISAAVSNTGSDSHDGWNVRWASGVLMLHMEGAARITAPLMR